MGFPCDELRVVFPSFFLLMNNLSSDKAASHRPTPYCRGKKARNKEKIFMLGGVDFSFLKKEHDLIISFSGYCIPHVVDGLCQLRREVQNWNDYFLRSLLVVSLDF